jgi:hypothetical protein
VKIEREAEKYLVSGKKVKPAKSGNMSKLSFNS